MTKLIICIAISLCQFPAIGQLLTIDHLLKGMDEIQSLQNFDDAQNIHSLSIENYVETLKLDEDHSKNALFCRIEDRLESSSKLFVKFRIGSVAIMDRLEGYDRSILSLEFAQSQYYYPANPKHSFDRKK